MEFFLAVTVIYSVVETVTSRSSLTCETNRIQQQSVCFVETCTRSFIYSECTQLYMYSIRDCYTVVTHLL